MQNNRFHCGMPLTRVLLFVFENAQAGSLSGALCTLLLVLQPGLLVAFPPYESCRCPGHLVFDGFCEF